MDHTELTEEFLLEKVVTPVVLGMFADDEWDSIALDRDHAGQRRRIARIVVARESVEVLVDYPGSTESVYEIQLRLIGAFKDFIDRSDFGRLRDPEWTAREPLAERRDTGLVRPLRPSFHGPSDCTLRRRRIGRRNLRFDRRRCRSAHRRD